MEFLFNIFLYKTYLHYECLLPKDGTRIVPVIYSAREVEELKNSADKMILIQNLWRF